MSDAYNYRNFTLGPAEGANVRRVSSGPRLGERGPDAKHVDAATHGHDESLGDKLDSARPLVERFGVVRRVLVDRSRRYRPHP